uniref:Choline transporter-like protein n=1 Tax=Aceria tosichella TaxID=561515 RepID=A0A6G1S636_9ACAR
MGCFCGDSSAPADGDDKQRKCTDKFWLILFVICWIVLTVAGIWSFYEGNPNRLVRGYDSFGNICGQKNKHIPGVSWSGMDMSDCPYVFHMNPFNTSSSLKVCVQKCADRNLTNDGDILLLYQRTGSELKRYDINLNDRDLQTRYYPKLSPNDIATRRKQDEDRGFGPFPKLPVFKQRPVLNRCVSLERIKLGNSVVNNFYKFVKNLDVAHKFVSDIYTSWKHIAYTVLFGIGVSLLVTFTIHYVASLVSTIIMVVSSLALIALSAFTWYVYIDLKYKLKQIPTFEQIDDDFVNEKTFLALAIVFTVITLIILIITFVMRSRIGLMVALFDETAACLRSMPALVFQPIWTCAALLVFLVFWTAVFLAVSTAEKDVIYDSKTTRFQLALPARRISKFVNGEAIFEPEANLYSLESVKHEQPDFVRYLWWFVVLMLFWSSEFILGCQQMTVASSVASWYFTRDRSSLVCPIGNSIKRVTNYHLGSIALGSFLIVLLKIPRLILTYTEYYLRKFKDSNSCVNCVLKCCQCFFYCLENFVRYINHNAYTIIAIEGTDYCFSAKVAFKTLATNTLRIVTINTMGDFIIFLGKCLVTATSATFGVYLMRDDPSIHYLAVPVIFAAVCAYLVAHSMLCVYEMVIDTMFLCFVEDVNKNANSHEGFFAPEGLLKFAQEDGRELKPEALRIAKELNISRPPAPNDDIPQTKQPSIGFVYPNLVESSH